MKLAQCDPCSPLPMCPAWAKTWDGETARCSLACGHSGRHATSWDFRDPRTGRFLAGAVNWENEP